jgi:hypothetical protein
MRSSLTSCFSLETLDVHAGWKDAPYLCSTERREAYFGMLHIRNHRYNAGNPQLFLRLQDSHDGHALSEDSHDIPHMSDQDRM